MLAREDVGSLERLWEETEDVVNHKDAGGRLGPCFV